MRWLRFLFDPAASGCGLGILIGRIAIAIGMASIVIGLVGPVVGVDYGTAGWQMHGLLLGRGLIAHGLLMMLAGHVVVGLLQLLARRLR